MEYTVELEHVMNGCIVKLSRPGKYGGTVEQRWIAADQQAVDRACFDINTMVLAEFDAERNQPRGQPGTEPQP